MMHDVASNDRTLTLINRGQITAADFDEHEGGAVMLGDKGRRAVVTAWQERKQEEVTHPLTEKKIPSDCSPSDEPEPVSPGLMIGRGLKRGDGILSRSAPVVSPGLMIGRGLKQLGVAARQRAA